MPQIDAGVHLIAFLYEVGPVMPGGFGPVPITHQELAAWQENTGVELEAWEARSLRALSREYHTQAQKSEEPNCPAPYGLKERRALVARKIDEIFG